MSDESHVPGAEEDGSDEDEQGAGSDEDGQEGARRRRKRSKEGKVSRRASKHKKVYHVLERGWKLLRSRALATDPFPTPEKEDEMIDAVWKEVIQGTCLQGMKVPTREYRAVVSLPSVLAHRSNGCLLASAVLQRHEGALQDRGPQRAPHLLSLQARGEEG